MLQISKNSALNPYRVFFLLIIFLVWPIISQAQCVFNQPQDRIALVIGNNHYEHVTSLKNAANDARAIAEVLRNYNYSVIEKTDLRLTDMAKTISCFETAMKPGGVAFFYYAGHGVQLGQHNYLLPTDLKIIDRKGAPEKQLRSQSIDFNDILLAIKHAQLATNVIVLDACRNNPFSDNSRGIFDNRIQRKLSEIAEQGFAEISEAAAPPKSYIAFATAPGKTAYDGDDKHGLFTYHLLKYMKNPLLDISMVFARTAADVYDSSDHDQVPWRKTSLFDAFYFSPNATAKNAAFAEINHSFDQNKYLRYFTKGKKLLYEKNRPKKAIASFKRALKHSSDKADIYFHMAKANALLHNHAEAIVLYNKTINLNPFYASAYTAIAASYQELGDHENAQRYLSAKP